ncbi:MAG: NADPH-quinone oxidoreductase [Candidatus Caenarcaniphilales bacterium]|nr:NADPH-quinone oxidoreductase [Candidatus Caenarcaniphilales bacterium]
MSIILPERTELKELKTEEMVINMGPHHPATHGVLRLKLKLDGEYVKEVEPVIGYLHRAIEKQAEQRSFFNYQVDIDRVDYLAGMHNNEAFSLAVEQLIGLEIPDKAKYIRAICSELNRITSHLLWLGTCLIDMGAMMGFPFYPFRERDRILNFLEEISGQRMMFNFVRIGGVKREPTSEWLNNVRKFAADEFPVRVREYEAIATENPIFMQRMQGIGYLPPEIALSHNMTGPSVRASGVNLDLRKTADYSVFRKFDFEVPADTTGDCYARYRCRIKELYESAKIIVQAIDGLPEGAINAKKIMPGLKPPKGESYAAVESPRGHLGVYVVSDGSSAPYRVRWHSPSFNNVSILPYLLLQGGQGQTNLRVSDIMACIASLDFIMPDVDR